MKPQGTSIFKTVLACVGLLAPGSFPSMRAHAHEFDHLSYSLGMSSDFVESDTVRARVLSVDAGIKISESLAPGLRFHLHAFGNFENGSNQTTTIRGEYEPNQAVNLREGGLVYTPSESLRFELGAMNQNRHQSPLLTWNTTFAGAQEEFRWGILHARAQQAVPNNNILARRVGGINEGTPLFFMETLGISQENSQFRWRLDASLFTFKDLSGQVAAVSRDFGNSVIGLTERTSTFLYGFDGYNLSGELSGSIHGRVRAMTEWQFLRNLEAPAGRNSGFVAMAGLGTADISVKLGLFRNESDSSPAFYNARLFGHNNMQGSLVTLQGGGLESAYSYRLNWVNGALIRQNPLQADTQIISFMIMRNYGS